jgi:hypothetical protein
VDVSEALEKIFREQQFRALQTDKGKEFFNARVASVLDKYNTHHFTSENEVIKASLVERFNRSLRNRIHRYLTAKSSKNFLGALPGFVDAYNDTEHKSIGLTPNQVDESNQREVFNRLYESGADKKALKILNPLEIGTFVRITKAKGAFERGYTPNWTREVFKIKKVLSSERPTVYVIEDYNGEEIKGTFYRQELQRVKEPKVYEIEKVLRTRRRAGKTQHLVKWLGYSDSFNSWVDEKDMM